MSITTYAELQTAVQSWLDNNNPNVVAAIPDAIALAEANLSRVLRTWEMECRVPTPLVPAGVAEEELGYYDLPSEWAGHKALIRQAEDLLIIYWKRLTPLSDTNTSNWLLLKHPDIYLYNSLLQLAGFAKSAEEIARWREAAIATLQAIKQADWEDMYPDTAFTTTVPNTARSISLPSMEMAYVIPKRYDDIEAVGSTVYYRLPGVYTISAGKIRIWPKPEMPTP